MKKQIPLILAVAFAMSLFFIFVNQSFSFEEGSEIPATQNQGNTISISEAAGHHISFFGFMKYAFVYMLMSVAICNIWLLVFY